MIGLSRNGVRNSNFQADGNYYSTLGVPLKGLYRVISYIGIMEKKMETAKMEWILGLDFGVRSFEGKQQLQANNLTCPRTASAETTCMLGDSRESA